MRKNHIIATGGDDRAGRTAVNLTIVQATIVGRRVDVGRETRFAGLDRGERQAFE